LIAVFETTRIFDPHDGQQEETTRSGRKTGQTEEHKGYDQTETGRFDGCQAGIAGT
jgi:hypothetical protein